MLKHYLEFAEIEAKARRKLPRSLCDYISGGASSEYTVEANRRAFDDIAFSPRAMVDIRNRTTRTKVLGREIDLPVIAGPAGLARLVHKEGEVAVAKATAKAGTIFCLSNASAYSLEEVAEHTNGPVWFQLFSCKPEIVALDFIQRAKAARCEGLILAVDLPIGGLRYSEERTGLTYPPKITLSSLVDFACHPEWLAHIIRWKRFALGNYEDTINKFAADTDGITYMKDQVLNPGNSWEDVVWLRRHWDGPLILKGIMSAHDAKAAATHGADAIIVSNHGGRQLDWNAPTIEVLPEIVDEVDGKLEVLIDGGVRCGSDVIKAIALGAKACVVARPWFWALAADGEFGVTELFRIFKKEIDNVLGLIGRTGAEALDREAIRFRSSAGGIKRNSITN